MYTFNKRNKARLAFAYVIGLACYYTARAAGGLVARLPYTAKSGLLAYSDAYAATFAFTRRHGASYPSFWLGALALANAQRTGRGVWW